MIVLQLLLLSHQFTSDYRHQAAVTAIILLTNDCQTWNLFRNRMLILKLPLCRTPDPFIRRLKISAIESWEPKFCQLLQVLHYDLYDKQRHIKDTGSGNQSLQAVHMIILSWNNLPTCSHMVRSRMYHFQGHLIFPIDIGRVAFAATRTGNRKLKSNYVSGTTWPSYGTAKACVHMNRGLSALLL